MTASASNAPLPEQTQAPARRGWGTALAFVAGYVDTLGFIALYGLFTSHVTGNFVLIGKSLVEPDNGVLLKLLVFPAFVAAVAFARLLSLALARRGRSAIRPLLLLQTLLLVGFMVAGQLATPITSTDGPLPMVTGMLAALAMGLQNAQGRLELATLVPTTVMTGNVTQVVIDLVDVLAGHAVSDRAAVKARLAKMLPSVAGFGLGAFAGAAAWQAFAFWAVLLPVAILTALAGRRTG